MRHQCLAIHQQGAFEWKTLKHLLPATGKIHKIVHRPAVPYPELPALMAALRERTSRSARTLEFAILCASRPNEALGAVGSEFDLAHGRWKIPAERMKGDRPHTVMLSKRAVEIIRELHPDGLKPDQPVFRLTRVALKKMLALAGYSDATTHGTARASFKTWADECTAFKDAVSEACLAHIEGDKVKAAYARGEFEAQRAELMEMWARHCASPPVDAADNVVPLRSIG
jgi:integrase